MIWTSWQVSQVENIYVGLQFDGLRGLGRADCACGALSGQQAESIHPPAVDFGHSVRQLVRQVSTRQVDVIECRREAPVAREHGNLARAGCERMRSVRQRCRSVWVLSRSTPDLIATPRTTLDQVHGVIAARFYREMERNRGAG